MQEKDDWYDTAQICMNGHVITEYATSSPAAKEDYCHRCGQPTITECKKCNSQIRGYRHISGIGYISTKPPVAPNFCYRCGQAYPWAEAKLNTAKELADELQELSNEDKHTLKESLDDIVKDTPATEVAAMRFKRILAKVGRDAAKALKDLVVDIASEAAKKVIVGQ